MSDDRRSVVADRPLAVLMGLAVIVRVVFAWWASRGAPDAAVLSDQYQYWAFGHQLADGNGYRPSLTAPVSAYYPPGWPVIIAVVTLVVRAVGLGHHDVTAVVLLQIAFGVTTVWLVYRLTLHVAGRRTALVAAGITAVLPSLVFSSANFSVESAFIASYLAALLVIVRHDWTSGAPAWKQQLLFGALIGLSAQIRPFSMPMLVGLPLAALVARLGWRVALRGFAIAALACAALFVPWTVRNAVQMHTFLPSSTNLGDTLCMSRFPGSDTGFHWATHEWCADPSLPEVERNRANMSAALHFIADHPLEEVRQIGRRVVLMMETDHTTLDEVINNWGVTESSRDHLPVLAWTADIAYWLLLALAAPGIVLLALHRRRQPELTPLALALASLVLIPLGLWGATRFHLPFLPLLAIPAAVTVVRAATCAGEDTAT